MNKEEIIQEDYITFSLDQEADPVMLFEFIKNNLYFWQVMDLYKLLKEEIEKGDSNE